MREINAEIIEIILADNTIKTLLGHTTTDERIYAWNPSEDVIYSSSKKGAIFYKEITGKRPSKWSYPKQFANSTIFFKVVSIDQENTDKLSERLIELFDLGTLETTNWRVGFIELLSYNDTVTEGSPTNTQWTKMVTFRFSNVFKRT
jgi:hypothetical protein